MRHVTIVLDNGRLTSVILFTEFGKHKITKKKIYYQVKHSCKIHQLRFSSR